MALTSALIKHLELKLTEFYGSAANIKNHIPVSGGSINEAYCLQTTAGLVMLKLNNTARYPGMFAREAEGLTTIFNAGAIAVPTVILQDDFDDESFLLMEWIESRRPTTKAFEQLGRQLAELHRHTAESFGFEGDNYIGSLPQNNKHHETWAEFFAEQRLKPMLEAAVETHLLNKADIQNFERLYARLPELFDEETPALLHGDLWGGNYLIRADEKPYLIDPAVYYGHREADIAMTTLFGGFSDAFYHAYLEAFPLQSGWRERLDLWNLYPLLVHVNLFGGSYVGQVREVLKRYV